MTIYLRFLVTFDTAVGTRLVSATGAVKSWVLFSLCESRACKMGGGRGTSVSCNLDLRSLGELGQTGHIMNNIRREGEKERERERERESKRERERERQNHSGIGSKDRAQYRIAKKL